MITRARSLFLVSLLSAVAVPAVFFGCAGSSNAVSQEPVATQEGAETIEDPLAARRGQVVDRLLVSIVGRENEPAGNVFENVQMLGNMPAGRFLRLMDQGFSKALGVGCNHCHDTNVWEADHKRPKKAAREMWQMVQEINQVILPGLENLDGSRPTINCTTCHRGEVRPALNLE